MATLNGLPVFKIKISEDLNSETGIDFISMVDYPAIETNWIAMSDERPKMFFSTDKKLVAGPILIPDLPIYRYDKVRGEYYVVFTKEEIQIMLRKFQKQNKNLNLNFQHQPNSQVNAVIQEVWLTGKKDKSQDYGFNLPEGSAFVISFIEDDKFWNEQVKTNNVRGYSIEGWLDMELKKIKNINMANEKFVEAKTNDGVTLKSTAEVMAVGVDLMVVDAEGKETPAEGEYTLENGTIIKAAAGKIDEIIEPASQDLTPEEQAALENMFQSIIKPLRDKIDALELKLSNIPGGKSATSATDENDKKEIASPKKTLLEKINRAKLLKKAK